MALDDRVSAIGIFNSGELNQTLTTTLVAKITKPIFFVLGGPTDIAYQNVGFFLCWSLDVWGVGARNL
jgi:hypothetical protein